MVSMRQPRGENRLGDCSNMNMDINMDTEDDGTGKHDDFQETLKAAFALCRMRYRGDDRA